MNIPKYYWHVHHKQLWEERYEPIKNRRQYIKEEKYGEEVPLRLRLLKPVKKLPKILVDAYRENNKAQIAHNRAESRVQKILGSKIYNRKRYDRAEEAYAKARAKLDDSVIILNKMLCSSKLNQAMNEQHKKECKNCTWNGRTIFSKGWEKSPLAKPMVRRRKKNAPPKRS